MKKYAHTKSGGGDHHMKIHTIALGLGAGLLLSFASVPAHAASKNFIAVMNGGQETPTPTTSNAFGVAFFTFDTKTGQLCYRITYTHLDNGAEVAAHIHGPAVPGPRANVLGALADGGSPKNHSVTPDAATLNAPQTA